MTGSMEFGDKSNGHVFCSHSVAGERKEEKSKLPRFDFVIINQNTESVPKSIQKVVVYTV